MHIRDNNQPIAMVDLNGTLYRCEIWPRRTDYDFEMWENLTYSGCATINTGDECFSYNVDRTNTNQPYVANLATKRGSVDGRNPLDAPISQNALAIHHSLDNPPARWEDFN